jgi:hypothetical protein
MKSKRRGALTPGVSTTDVRQRLHRPRTELKHCPRTSENWTVTWPSSWEDDAECRVSIELGKFPDLKKKTTFWQIIVAHACNLSYLGGWDLEDYSLRPVRANSSQDPISTSSCGQWQVPVLTSYPHREAEIRRTTAPGHLGQKSWWDPISTGKKLGVVAYACHPSYGRKCKVGLCSTPAWAKGENFSPK